MFVINDNLSVSEDEYVEYILTIITAKFLDNDADVQYIADPNENEQLNKLSDSNILKILRHTEFEGAEKYTKFSPFLLATFMDSNFISIFDCNITPTTVEDFEYILNTFIKTNDSLIIHFVQNIENIMQLKRLLKASNGYTKINGQQYMYRVIQLAILTKIVEFDLYTNTIGAERGEEFIDHVFMKNDLDSYFLLNNIMYYFLWYHRNKIHNKPATLFAIMTGMIERMMEMDNNDDDLKNKLLSKTKGSLEEIDHLHHTSMTAHSSVSMLEQYVYDTFNPTIKKYINKLKLLGY